jgi:hypothetical protein
MQKQTSCPECYLMGNHEVALESRPGSNPKCPNGHTWDDMEVLQNRLALARNKRAAAEGKPADPNPEEQKKKVAAMQKPKGDEVVISADDYQRISAKVGDFPDGATLFGKIHSLFMDINNLTEELNNLRTKQSQAATAPASSDPAPVAVAGGDMKLEIVIPEQHVQPIKDMAEATHTSTVRYVNGVIESGLANGWFY